MCSFFLKLLHQPHASNKRCVVYTIYTWWCWTGISANVVTLGQCWKITCIWAPARAKPLQIHVYCIADGFLNAKRSIFLLLSLHRFCTALFRICAIKPILCHHELKILWDMETMSNIMTSKRSKGNSIETIKRRKPKIIQAECKMNEVKIWCLSYIYRMNEGNCNRWSSRHENEFFLNKNNQIGNFVMRACAHAKTYLNLSQHVSK